MNYVNIVIKPLDNATNAITVQAKPGEFIVIVILASTGKFSSYVKQTNISPQEIIDTLLLP